MPWYPEKEWVKLCPYPGYKPPQPLLAPVKHMKHVKDMAPNRKSIYDLDAYRGGNRADK